MEQTQQNCLGQKDCFLQRGVSAARYTYFLSGIEISVANRTEGYALAYERILSRKSEHAVLNAGCKNYRAAIYVLELAGDVCKELCILDVSKNV